MNIDRHFTRFLKWIKEDITREEMKSLQTPYGIKLLKELSEELDNLLRKLKNEPKI